MEYTIIGYYPEHGWWALIKPVGSDKEHALAVLKQMLTEPTDNDKKLIGKATILSIDTVSKENAWWNDPFLAN
mgnify:FL=1